MANNDRMVYQAVFGLLDMEPPGVSKPPSKGKRKKITDKLPFRLTIPQKKLLLDAGFAYAMGYASATDVLANHNAKANDTLKNTANAIDKVLAQLVEPTKGRAGTHKELAALDDATVLQLAGLAAGVRMQQAHKLAKAPAGEIRFYLPAEKRPMTSLATLVGGQTLFPSNPIGYANFLRPMFGYLHLERLRFTPVDVELGELLYSLPLAPGEEVSLTQKTWAKIKREFTEIVASEIEKEITTERTESLELSESTQNQSQFHAEMSSSGQGSGTIGVISFTASATNSFGTSFSQTAEVSKKHTRQVTEKATARSKQEHKTTFQVSSEVGFEDESRRLIKNPNTTHAVRYDYFRYMRKWKVDIERYGVRLTMDVMVPDPGNRLRAEYDRKRELERLATGNFSCSFTASDIDENNLPEGAPPKPQEGVLTKSDTIDPKISHSGEHSYDFDIPAGFEIGQVQLKKTGGGGGAEVRPSTAHYVGMTGRVSVQVHAGVAAGEDRVSYQVKVMYKPTSLSQWQSQVVAAACLIEEQRFQAAKASAQAELDRVVIKEKEQPTLLLRKDEREEILRGAMELFLAPGMEPAEAPDTVVRFMHEAFEWENMSYYLYPYFWQDIPTALEVEHSDLLRRDFLRAGWARVLVPIRPDYEESVLAFAYTGNPSNIGALGEMRSIAQQVMDANKTRYAYQTAADNTLTEKFDVVATWFEYTPTDAVDIRVNLINMNIAEPALAQRLDDEHARQVQEMRLLQIDQDVRTELRNIMQNRDATVKVTKVETGIGDSIELGE